jgi:translation initiation factor 3 subunit D
MGYDPRKFGDQLGINLNNGWGIVRTIVDMILSKAEDGKNEVKYVLVKDPNKPLLRLYEVPVSTFEEGEDDEEPIAEGGEDDE